MVFDVKTRTGATDDHSTSNSTFHILELHVGTAGWILGLLAVITAIGVFIWWLAKRRHRKKLERQAAAAPALTGRELVPYYGRGDNARTCGCRAATEEDPEQGTSKKTRFNV